MKNRRGFTLVEIMVAMGLLVLVVFCFTPFMLSSYQNVVMAGGQRIETLGGKGEIEKEIANGISVTVPADDQVSITFTQGSVSQETGTQGKMVEDNEGKFASFLGKDEGSMSIAPSRISESCPSNTVIKISSDFVDLTSYDKFTLSIGNQTYTNASSYLAFQADVSDPKNPHKAQMIIKDSTGLGLRMGVNCVLTYRDHWPTTLRVSLPSLIAVGENGTLLTRRENGEWQASFGVGGNTLGSNTLRDIVWTGTQYVAAGDNGAFFYTPDEETWTKNDTATGQIAAYHFSDLAADVRTGKLDIAGFQKNGSTEYGYRYVDLSDLSANLIPDGVIDNTVMRYTAVGATADVPLWASYAIGKVETASHEVVKINESPVFSILSPANTDITLTSVGWNNAMNPDTEYAAAGANGQIYNCLPNEKASTLEWKPNTNTNVAMPEDGDSSPETTYYVFENVTKEGSSTTQTIKSPEDLTPQWDANKRKYYLLYQNEKYYLSAIWPASKKYSYQVKMVYARSDAQLTGGRFHAVCYYNNVTSPRLVAGGNISLDAAGEYRPVIDQHVTVFQWTWLFVGSDWKSWGTEKNITLENIESGDHLTSFYPLIYRDNKGTWNAAKLENGSSWPRDATINAIEYLGDLFVAVGNDGLIATSQDGATWKVEQLSVGSKPDLYGVAGWGLS